MKYRLLNLEHVDDEVVVTIEQTRGFVWKAIEEFQVRGYYDEDLGGDWYYYPDGDEVPWRIGDRINALVQELTDEKERQERVKQWKL